jgi:hypothetical protein
MIHPHINFTTQLTVDDSVSPRTGMDVAEKRKMQARLNKPINH